MKIALRHQAWPAGQRPPKRLAGHMRRPFICIALSASLLLSGCGGYARNAGGSSGIEVYGVIDASVQRERSR